MGEHRENNSSTLDEAYKVALTIVNYVEYKSQAFNYKKQQVPSAIGKHEGDVENNN